MLSPVAADISLYNLLLSPAAVDISLYNLLLSPAAADISLYNLLLSPVAASISLYNLLLSPVAVRPLRVWQEGENGPLSVGKPYEYVCQSSGARPPATLTWYLDGAVLVNTRQHVSYSSLAPQYCYSKPMTSPAHSRVNTRQHVSPPPHRQTNDITYTRSPVLYTNRK